MEELSVITLKPKPIDLTKKPEALKDWPEKPMLIKLDLAKDTRENKPVPAHVPFVKGMQRDFRDVRFFDSNHEVLSYFLPEANIKKTEAIPFVRVSRQAIADNFIYCTYGNHACFKGSHPSALKLRIDRKKKVVLDKQLVRPQPISAVKLVTEVTK